MLKTTLLLVGAGLLLTCPAKATVAVGPAALGTNGTCLYYLDSSGVQQSLATTTSDCPASGSGPATGVYASKPAATTVGGSYYATDLGVTGMQLVSTGALWKPVGVGVLAQNFTASPLMQIVGTTAITQTLLAQVVIPAGLPSVNSCFRVTSHWLVTNDANSKTFAVTYSTTAGTVNSAYSSGTSYFAGSATTNVSYRNVLMICNQHSASAQVGTPASYSGLGGGAGDISTSFNTATTITYISFTGTPGNSADTVTLVGYTVEWIEP